MPTGINYLAGTGMGSHYPCPSCPTAIPKRKGGGCTGGAGPTWAEEWFRFKGNMGRFLEP
uniref:Uncharacterized protein n=1 Tax=Oryza sativa subsp. japonica TaxID=39947 RepID=Q69MG7_ORYSJ|nr:hypothetical protein [Oryza sativa Japonica Group]BAD36326.1 hypothetical protein [Oryza sativa Japonica Group]